MKEFLLIFRMDVAIQTNVSPEDMQNRMKLWQDWMGSIAAQNKLVSSGNRLATEGRVVRKDNLITNGPYVEIKEAIGGYSIVRAGSLDEAAEIANGCPILMGGGTVEVRTIVPMD